LERVGKQRAPREEAHRRIVAERFEQGARASGVPPISGAEFERGEIEAEARVFRIALEGFSEMEVGERKLAEPDRKSRGKLMIFDARAIGRRNAEEHVVGEAGLAAGNRLAGPVEARAQVVGSSATTRARQASASEGL